MTDFESSRNARQEQISLSQTEISGAVDIPGLIGDVASYSTSASLDAFFTEKPTLASSCGISFSVLYREFVIKHAEQHASSVFDVNIYRTLCGPWACSNLASSLPVEGYLAILEDLGEVSRSPSSSLYFREPLKEWLLAQNHRDSIFTDQSFIRMFDDGLARMPKSDELLRIVAYMASGSDKLIELIGSERFNQAAVLMAEGRYSSDSANQSFRDSLAELSRDARTLQEPTEN